MGEPGDLRDGTFTGITDENDSILLVRHNYGEGLFSLPGGGIKKGEIVIAGARREIREETSLTQIKLRQIGTFTLVKRYGLVVLFEATHWSGSPRSDLKEIAECLFVTRDDLYAMDGHIYPAQLKLAHIFFEYRDQRRPIYGKLTDPPEIEFEAA